MLLLGFAKLDAEFLANFLHTAAVIDGLLILSKSFKMIGNERKEVKFHKFPSLGDL